MAETVGSLIDKISIIQLKLYHMEEQTRRAEATPQHVRECRDRIAIMWIQRADLGAELDTLLENLASGNQHLKIYRQFKMYNDQKYRH